MLESFCELLTASFKEMCGEGSEYELCIKPKLSVNQKSVLVHIKSAESDHVQVVPAVDVSSWLESHSQLSESESAKLLIEELFRLQADPESDPVVSASEQLTAAELSKVDRYYVCAVNTELNKDFLQTVPHRDLLDLSLVLRYRIDTNTQACKASLVLTNEIASSLEGITVDSIFDNAIERCKGISSECMSMSELLGSFLEDDTMCEFADGVVGLFIPRSYKDGYNAGEQLLSGVVQKLADRAETDVAVIPSSIHEILLVPLVIESLLEDLPAIVREVNSAAFFEQRDFLSNSVYVFRHSTRRLEIYGKEESICF